MENILEINNLTVVYGKKPVQKKAVYNLNLSVKKGEIFGFLGPNGAGKTSTIKALLGLIIPHEGSIVLFGRPHSYILRKSIGYMPEVANYYWYLSPRELLTFYGGLFNMERKSLLRRVDELLDLVGLRDSTDSLMKTFSKGMLQKVSFAQSLINDPELLILDEPTTGLDPISRMNMRKVLLDLKRAGKTIFFSSHELSEVELISDRVAIVKKGKVFKESGMKDLVDSKGEHMTLENYFFEFVKDA